MEETADLVRPYKTLGYPVIPILFLIGAAALELSTLRDRPVQSMAGILLILLGLPFYYTGSESAPGLGTKGWFLSFTKVGSVV